MSSPSPVRIDVPLPRKQIEILVVESDPADTLLTEMAFKAAGLTSGFRSVSDGQDALAYVHKEGKYANVATPDLIFLDLSIPKIAGLEVLKSIKTTPHLMRIPIVVASSIELFRYSLNFELQWYALRLKFLL